MKSNSGNSDKSMNNWFSNNIKYEGQGRAEFTTPQGFIEGFTKIHFDELGNSTLEMAVDNFYAEPTLRLDLMKFFSSEPPLQEGDNVSLRGRLGTNPCISLTVMVGEIGSHSIDIADLRDWIPFGFLPLLSLATGSEVGVPWIEFRDANGELVRRIHDNFSKPNFSTGYATISESVHRSTGYLLSQAQSSPNYGKAPLGSVIFDLVQSSSDNLAIEDKLNRICRAFDYLCKHHQLDTQNLLIGLDQSNQDIVNTVLRSAEQQIRSVAQNMSDPAQSQLLIRIADKTINASNKDRNFGLAVTDLLKQCGLHDAEIIDAHYQSNPRSDGTKHWSGVLSNYRGIAVHKGDFGFQSGTYDVYDVVRITYHLHDILVRIVFKMLGYDRTYQPIIVRTVTEKHVDWVTPTLSASELGY
jgi:hypothetical protein